MLADKNILEDLINIYHEILINEISIMRSNTIIDEGKDVGNAIVYFNTLYPLQGIAPNASRGLDYIVLAYTVINGVRRIVCGYNILRPTDPEPKCNDNEIKSKIQVILKGIGELDGAVSVGDWRLERLVAKLIIAMIKHGLIFIVPRTVQDNLNVTAAVRDISSFKNESGMQIAEVKVESFQDLYSLIVAHKLERFFREYKIEFSRRFGSKPWKPLQYPPSTLTLKVVHDIGWRVPRRA